MKKLCKQQKSFVLIFTITILTLVTLLTHQLLRLVNVGVHFDRAMVDRERAEMLALGGINIAIAQLTEKQKKTKKKTKLEKTKKEDQKSTSKKNLEAFLQRVLPHLNRWQVFDLKEEVEGIDGNLQICISCENGKININEAFDFKKQDFKPAYKKFLGGLKFIGKKKSTGLFLKNLTKFLKKRNRKIDDISELQASDTQKLQLFYEPPQRTQKPRDAKPNVALAIQDIFTIWTHNDKLEGLMLSDALCAMLGFKRPAAHDAKLQKETFRKIIKRFKPETDQNAENYWKIVRPLYKPKSTFKVQNIKIFSPKFEPTTYSVLSSGKVGNVEQRVLAILEKNIDKTLHEPKQEKKDKTKKESTSKQIQQQAFRVVRLYWI